MASNYQVGHIRYILLYIRYMIILDIYYYIFDYVTSHTLEEYKNSKTMCLLSINVFVRTWTLQEGGSTGNIPF